MRPLLSYCFIWLLALFLPAAALAQSQALVLPPIIGREGATPIVVVPFAWQSASTQDPANDMASIIRSNLNRSGQFRSLDLDRIVERPSQLEQVRWDIWRQQRQNYLVVGRVLDNPDATQRVEFQLANVVTGEQMLSLALQSRRGEERSVAHQISDLIYEKITGVRGAFWTRIAYVTATGLGNNIRYRLVVADSDGFNPQNIVQSNEPLMSPAWSPDGRRLAYVSFERGNSAIYIQEIATGARRLVSSFKGINGAPAFSPDGNQLAMALSRTGNPEITILDLTTNQFTQVTRNLAIDTEPVWLPDGRELLFTSDRGGRPQIYRVSAAGGEAARVSFQGDYNARISVSADGQRWAMVQGNRNVYRIAVADRRLGDTAKIITDGRLDESPSFAPNGSMILYASREGVRGVLYAVSSDGRVKQRLAYADGDVREPAWSPFRQR
jgi:TolB protein